MCALICAIERLSDKAFVHEHKLHMRTHSVHALSLSLSLSLSHSLTYADAHTHT